MVLRSLPGVGQQAVGQFATDAYARQTLSITDGDTGEKIRQARLFVTVLGASNYTDAEAIWTQKLPDWIGSHVQTFEFFGGVIASLVPDNIKSGVKHREGASN
jgi:transposase